MRKIITESQLRQIVKESVGKVLKEYAWATGPSYRELEKILDKVERMLKRFQESIPQEQVGEFWERTGKEWRDLKDSLYELQMTVFSINNPRGLSDGDLTFDDLS